jgi:hypothetical protein
MSKVFQIQAQLAQLLHQWGGFQDAGSEQVGYQSMHPHLPPHPQVILKIVKAIRAGRVAT